MRILKESFKTNLVHILKIVLSYQDAIATVNKGVFRTSTMVLFLQKQLTALSR